MDLDNEIAKCDKKLDLVRLNLQKVVKLESQAEYEETVPLNVRAANEEKVMFFTYLLLACSAILTPSPFRGKHWRQNWIPWKLRKICL